MLRNFGERSTDSELERREKEEEEGEGREQVITSSKQSEQWAESGRRARPH